MVTALSPVSDELLAYAREVALREDEILRELRMETALLPGGSAMQVMAEEGQLLTFLGLLLGARTVLEIGTYTGYSTLCLARGLAPGGRVVTCDLSPRWPAIAAPYWQRAGVADLIDLRIGPATDTLEGLRTEGSVFDLAFVDADKSGYPGYYEQALALVRPGGLIAVDNTFCFGRVADPGAQDPETEAVHRLNTLLREDDRVDLALLPIADGLTLLRRR
jgi:O-methyltransferase